jgi:hypothetical protein
MSEAIAEAVRSLPVAREVRVEGDRIITDLTDPEQNRPELVKTVVDAGGRILEVFENRQPLEEVYLKLIHEESQNEP